MPQQTKLDPTLTKMAMEDPQAYVRHMQNSGRENELTPDDHVRAATMGLAQKVKGMFGSSDNSGSGGSPQE